MTEATTRRERLRAATLTEIKETARRHLVERGPAGISLRGIARDMGMTAPGLYRYYSSLEELVAELTADLCVELTADLVAARDATASTDPVDRLQVACRTFRRWGVAHPAEFGLVFGAAPLPGLAHELLDAKHVEAMRFSQVFLELFLAYWQQTRFPIPAPEELDPALRDQLELFVATKLPVEVPVGLAYRFVSSWIQLYGTVALEVFGHLHFALTDAEAMFEAELDRWVADLTR